MPTKLLPKNIWKEAVGAASKSRRLELKADLDGLFHCPVLYCDSNLYQTKRGCRKHVYNRHGWYYYFDEKPNVEEVLPQHIMATKKIIKNKRSKTVEMPMFQKECNFDKLFKLWLCSPGGGMRSYSQASQVSTRMLKYLKFCFKDSCGEWDIPLALVDYSLGCITSISDFIDFLKTEWNVGFAGIIGYMNSLSHALDFRRMEKLDKSHVFMASEIYLERVKKSLGKKMRSEWNILLSIDYLSKIDCWATLEDIQKVIPYHADKFTQILMNASTKDSIVPSHDLSFSTAFITCVLFIMVKASRPMTFQYLTVEMLKNIDKDGMIDQTTFKTKEKYGFDTLIFTKTVQDIVNGYIACLRPRLQPTCNYLLVTRNGKQLTTLSDVFGSLVYQAIGKYINPTRYRQIIETESAERLTVDDQKYLSEDQKHTSLVAKVHYQKLQSRNVAENGKRAMDKLRDENFSINALEKVKTVTEIKEPDFQIASSSITFQAETSHVGDAFDPKEEKQSKDDEIVGKLDQPAETTKTKTSRQRKVAFSDIEDRFLKKGLEKYGSQWTVILGDPEYKFHPSRKTATLLKRAKRCKFIE